MSDTREDLSMLIWRAGASEMKTAQAIADAIFESDVWRDALGDAWDAALVAVANEHGSFALSGHNPYRNRDV